MPDPIRQIEDKKGQIDLGVMVARIFEGALQESQSLHRAFWVTVAYCVGMFKSAQDMEEGGEHG